MAVLAPAVAGAVAVHLGATVLAARALGVGVAHVTVGIGPVALSGRRVTWRWLPVAGHVRLQGEAHHDPDAGVSAHEAGAPDPARAWAAQPTWKRVLLPVSGPLALAAAAVACAGPAALGDLATGCVEWVTGAVAPLTRGQALLAEAHAALASAGPWQGAGRVAAKLAALNLLPFTPFGGGQALLALVGGGPGHARRAAALAQALLWPALGLAVAWTVALAVYLVR